MNHTRMPLRAVTQREAVELIRLLESMDSSFSIENFDCSERVNARSLFGVLYMAIENSEDMYLVNNTKDGEFPGCLEQFRK